ncbi:MAG: formate--tetrahydrofolate ligase [Candidatus Methanomethylophilaceae archaeon]|nr:formate--tetrahydrofolate ligase [Candidatus Methanomethylophilaceae archaeon]MBR6213051.1 formate--tetrahydrofolate ligase [Candidatus Methanomethylophilaceae archaeon]
MTDIIVSCPLVLEKPRESEFRFSYEDSITLKEKIFTVATKIYGADTASFSPLAEMQILDIEANGYGALPICIAKTKCSLSDRPELKGAPKGWRLHIRDQPLRRRGIHRPRLRSHHADARTLQGARRPQDGPLGRWKDRRSEVIPNTSRGITPVLLYYQLNRIDLWLPPGNQGACKLLHYLLVSF